MTRDEYRRLLRSTARELRSKCPTVVPVRVRTTNRPGESYGWCVLNMKDKPRLSIVVRLRVRGIGGARAVTAGELVDTLRHEWAHAMMLPVQCEDHHGPEWGVAYSRTYRATLDDPDSHVVSKRPRRTR